MKKIFKKHSEAVLVFLAVVFLAVIAGFLYATMQLVIPQVNRTLVSPSVSGSGGFNLGSAAQIDYRGIATSTAVTSPTSPANTQSASTTVVGTTTGQ